jgi:putative endonuclease
MSKGGFIYIITNKNNSVLYIGVTSDLLVRIHEHKTKFYRNSFSAKYNLEKLIYYEVFQTIDEAILREKHLKGSSRKRKVDLINEFNKGWEDLYEEVLGW